MKFLEPFKRSVARILGLNVDSVARRERELLDRINVLKARLNDAREMTKAKTEALDVVNQRVEVLKRQLAEVRATAKHYAAQRDALKIKR
jgi:chromosome segregation ATPase